MEANLYKDFIDAVTQDSDVTKGLIAELRYSSDKLVESCNRMKESLLLQSKHLDYLDMRAARLDVLFKKLCAVNDK